MMTAESLSYTWLWRVTQGFARRLLRRGSHKKVAQVAWLAAVCVHRLLYLAPIGRSYIKLYISKPNTKYSRSLRSLIFERNFEATHENVQRAPIFPKYNFFFKVYIIILFKMEVISLSWFEGKTINNNTFNSFLLFFVFAFYYNSPSLPWL